MNLKLLTTQWGRRILIASILVLVVGIVLGQEVDIDPFAPGEWYVSPETVIAIGSFFAANLVRLFTALGKDWFGTDGNGTRWLAIGISAIIAGAGGYLSLGYLSDLSGLGGALSAALMTVISALGAMAKVEYDRQTFAAGVDRAEERAKAMLLRP